MWEIFYCIAVLNSGPYPDVEKSCGYLDTPFYTQESCEGYLNEVEVNILKGKNYYFRRELERIDKLRCKNREWERNIGSSNMMIGDWPEMMIGP